MEGRDLACQKRVSGTVLAAGRIAEHLSTSSAVDGHRRVYRAQRSMKMVGEIDAQRTGG